jgi:hypothetical protein
MGGKRGVLYQERSQLPKIKQISIIGVVFELVPGELHEFVSKEPAIIAVQLKRAQQGACDSG